MSETAGWTARPSTTGLVIRETVAAVCVIGVMFLFMRLAYGGPLWVSLADTVGIYIEITAYRLAKLNWRRLTRGAYRSEANEAPSFRKALRFAWSSYILRRALQSALVVMCVVYLVQLALGLFVHNELAQNLWLPVSLTSVTLSFLAFVAYTLQYTIRVYREWRSDWDPQHLHVT